MTTQKEFDEIVKKNTGKCPKMDCTYKVCCSSDTPNNLCYEKFIPDGD